MRAERRGDYFSRFESEHIPEIAWERMLEDQVVIAPAHLIKVLEDAKSYLFNEPGPNLEQRQQLVPPWYNYWLDLLSQKRVLDRSSSGGLVSSGEIIKLHGVKELVARSPHILSGALFVAGGEGHEGHRHAADYMHNELLGGRNNPFVVWCFEQDQYFIGKDRGNPFLPLEVRLSMWAHHDSVTVVTVLPRNDQMTDKNEHYNRLFKELGVEYFFVTADDPYLDEKRIRGKQDQNNIIPKLDVPRTTRRVRWLDYSEVDQGYEGIEVDLFNMRYSDGLQFEETVFVP